MLYKDTNTIIDMSHNINLDAEFIKYYAENDKTFPSKPDKRKIEKEYVNKHRFKTQAGNDISYSLLVEAINTIDRAVATVELEKYTNDLVMAIELESGLFEFSLIQISINKESHSLIQNVYHHHLVTICRNLDPSDPSVENKTLLPMIKNGFDPFFVAFLKPEQMHPERWKDIIHKKQTEEDAVNNMQATSLYKCKQCGDRRMKVTELQLRSIDEPVSRFYTCLTCFKTFIR